MNADQTTNLDSVLRRVQKLLAIANDDRANPAEAAAAASQAEKIMRKYQIENADLIEREMRESKSAMAMKAVFANMKRDDPSRPPAVKNPPWAQFLAVAIAKLNDCHARQGTDVDRFGKRTASLRFYGYAADVEVCAFLFDFLVGTLISALKQRQAKGLKDRTASEAYRKGFTSALTASLDRLTREKELERTTMSASRSLVISKEKAIVEAFGEFGYRTVKASTVRDGEAFYEGRRDGSKVDVGRKGIGSSGSSSGAPQLN